MKATNSNLSDRDEPIRWTNLDSLDSLKNRDNNVTVLIINQIEIY